MSPVLQVLAQYLSVEDIFVLSVLNRRMYNEWTTTRCIQAVDLRVLVQKRFGWFYKGKNPFHMVRKRMRAARMPINGALSRFPCTGGCGKTKSVEQELVDKSFCAYATCLACFRRNRTNYDRAWLRMLDEGKKTFVAQMQTVYPSLPTEVGLLMARIQLTGNLFIDFRRANGVDRTNLLYYVSKARDCIDTGCNCMIAYRTWLVTRGEGGEAPVTKKQTI